MGGDFGPQVSVPAAMRALSAFPELSILMVGDRAALSDLLSQHKFDASRVEIRHTTEVVAMDERPAYALRHRRDSSMRVALKAVSDGDAQACVSAGNTGALMAMSRCVLKMLPGIERPALISALPTRAGHKVHLLDLGANINCDSDILFQFGIMGHVMASRIENIDSPRVALLNVGKEAVKGNAQVKHAAQLLSETPGINYVGYIEGHEIFNDKADVVVCDGFVGNVCLKTCEGLTQLIIGELKKRLNPKWLMKLILPILQPQLARMLSGMNPDQYNGASLLGLRGIVVKSHGNADDSAYFNAIREAVLEVERQVPARIKDQLETVLMSKES
jgi:glycerol-3-phosphate acyltransferase PlsX